MVSSREEYEIVLTSNYKMTIKADSHIAFCARAIPLPCQVAEGLECVFLT